MREAIVHDLELKAPTVGRWWPSIGQGAPLRPGQHLGVLVRAGRELAILAPTGVGGVAVDLHPAGAWVSYGEPLLTMGEGGASLAAPVVAQGRSPDMPDDVEPVLAETDGTIYLRPAPDKPPFAQVGDTLPAQATVALVEVMKTFTPVRVPVAGELARICVQDGAPIEAGAVLFWVRP